MSVHACVLVGQALHKGDSRRLQHDALLMFGSNGAPRTVMPPPSASAAAPDAGPTGSPLKTIWQLDERRAPVCFLFAINETMRSRILRKLGLRMGAVQ